MEPNDKTGAGLSLSLESMTSGHALCGSACTGCRESDNAIQQCPILAPGIRWWRQGVNHLSVDDATGALPGLPLGFALLACLGLCDGVMNTLFILKGSRWHSLDHHPGWARRSLPSARQHAASNACLLGTALCAFVQLADLG